jgi:hypothetical protein
MSKLIRPGRTPAKEMGRESGVGHLWKAKAAGSVALLIIITFEPTKNTKLDPSHHAAVPYHHNSVLCQLGVLSERNISRARTG